MSKRLWDGGRHETATELPHEEIGAAALEAPQGVGDLHLHHNVSTEGGVELLVAVLRGVQEDRVDGASRLLDAGEAQIEIHAYGAMQSQTQRAR